MRWVLSLIMSKTVGLMVIFAKGDVQMCAMLSLVAPTELSISTRRVVRFVESYVGERIAIKSPVCSSLTTNDRTAHAHAAAYCRGLRPQTCPCRRHQAANGDPDNALHALRQVPQTHSTAYLPRRRCDALRQLRVLQRLQELHHKVFYLVRVLRLQIRRVTECFVF